MTTRRTLNPLAAATQLSRDVGPVGLFPLGVLLGLSLVERFDFAAFGVLSPGITGWRATFVILAIPTFVFVALSFRLEEPVRGATAGARSEDDDDVSIAEAFRRLRAIRSLKRTWSAAFLFGAGVLPFLSYLN